MKQFVTRIGISAVVVAVMTASTFVWLVGKVPAIPSLGDAPSLPTVQIGEPLTVLVRGWLWDPISRQSAAPLEAFPERLEQTLREKHGLESRLVQYEWTRIPGDLLSAGNQFTSYARELSMKAGGCINFVGHSAGAAMVYQAAASGVDMAYMGTLGLPTFGYNKPSSVEVWANFYTSTHADDVAGWMWAKRMPADVNLDLEMPHKDFWGAKDVALISADSIARSWRACR